MKMDGLDTDQNGDGYNDAESVQAPELLELAHAGFDWFCTHCSSGNRGDDSACANCSAPRYNTSKETYTPTQPEQAKKPEPASKPQPLPVPDETPQLLTLLAAGFVLLVIAFLCYMFFVKETVHEGHVKYKVWARTSKIEEWTPYTESQWAHRATERTEVKPVGGKGERAGYTLIPGSCVETYYETERYVCGDHQEKYDCSTSHTETESYKTTCTKDERYACGETCKDQGNGFAKCSTKYCTRSESYSCTKQRTITVKDPKTCSRKVLDYCDRKIYKPKCTYTSQKWVHVRELNTGGSEPPFHWPQVSLTALQREVRSESYTVTWAYTDDGETETFSRDMDPENYKGWKTQQPTWIKLNGLGVVMDYSATPFPE